MEHILYEVQDGVARLWHNRPQARNAESQGLLQELDDALKMAVADDAVRVIVIAGKGEHFSAGHDLKEAAMKRSNFTVEERWAFEERYYLGYAMNIWDCPKPTIAQVNGACIAGAFMVANMCDMVVASEDAFFSDPVCHTLGAAAVEVLVHPWVLGARKAKELLFTGGRITAREGLEMGMVNKVVPREQLEAEAMAMAQRIAQCDPFALRLVKRSINRGLDMQGFRSAIQAHFDTHELSHLSEGFQRRRAEGLANAIQRTPQADKA
ncbi:enoyl-CoA hydratase [Ramlibacter algicola]|uniref:Enoyl-CoA hydratase n=1 Tax=Ramlibacter algicola TaxID=2795217 RepID=A0A934USP3_9BURK|nr:enoyl-CoA hydratase [Ramlibacter algicola]MBK0393712.1 enoyl-CoA hydratase [Ramlibacter algicola]